MINWKLMKNWALLLSFSFAFLFSQEKIEILAYHGIPPEHSTLENYKLLKDLGFTINYRTYGNNGDAKKALDLAAAVGIKILLETPELYSNTTKTVNSFKEHKGLFGYFIKDEPNANSFISLNKLISEIRKTDDRHEFYINLFPNYAESAQLGTVNYYRYIQDYLKNVRTNIISFDNYSVTNNVVNDSWYKNLEYIAKVSDSLRRPFWGFILSTDVNNTYKTPTLESMKLQAFINLAYGAKGIQYFTYWTLLDLSGAQKFEEAVIKRNGAKGMQFNNVYTVNRSVRKLSPIFLNSTRQGTAHVGTVPSGTTEFMKGPEIFRQLMMSGNAVVSKFYNSLQKKNYFVVVNKDLQKNLLVNYSLSRSAVLIDSNGLQKTTLNGRLTVAPSDMLVFSYN